MKIRVRFFSILLVVSAIFFFNPAHAVVIDISGISVDSGTDVVLVVAEDENLGSGFDIGFWFTIEHFGTSFPTETQITLENSFHQVLYTLTGSDCGFTAGSGQGSVECDAFIGIDEDSLLVFGDLWTITFSDTFPDAANPDYTIGAGSMIAWGDDLHLINGTKVPAPGTLALLALGLAGLGFAGRTKA